MADDESVRREVSEASPTEPGETAVDQSPSAVDARLAGFGRPYAGYFRVGIGFKSFQAAWGNRQPAWQPWVDIEAAVLRAGPGARGVVLLVKSTTQAHICNVLNRDSTVIILDGQAGNEYTNFATYLQAVGMQSPKLAFVQTYP